MKDLFEEFCKEYNLTYDFELISTGFDSCQYKSYETFKAYLVFMYSARFREDS
jgi:hypothetical protein